MVRICIQIQTSSASNLLHDVSSRAESPQANLHFDPLGKNKHSILRVVKNLKVRLQHCSVNQNQTHPLLWRRICEIQMEGASFHPSSGQHRTSWSWCRGSMSAFSIEDKISNLLKIRTSQFLLKPSRVQVRPSHLRPRSLQMSRNFCRRGRDMTNTFLSIIDPAGKWAAALYSSGPTPSTPSPPTRKLSFRPFGGERFISERSCEARKKFLRRSCVFLMISSTPPTVVNVGS